MSDQAAVIMEGDFKDYTLHEVLEVTSLCRQLIKVVLSSADSPRGHLLLKAGQVLEATLIQSTQGGIQAFYKLLQGSFDSFRVLRFKNGAQLQTPIGSLVELMSQSAPPPEPPPALFSPTPSSPAPSSPAPSSPAPSSSPRPLWTSGASLFSGAKSSQSSSAPPPSPSALPTPTPLRSSGALPPSPFTSRAPIKTPPSGTPSSSEPPQLFNLGGPSGESSPSTSSPLLSESSLSAAPSRSKSLLSQSSSPLPMPTQRTPALDVEVSAAASEGSVEDFVETSVFSESQMSDLMALIEALERQREALTLIEGECRLLDERFSHLYKVLERGHAPLEHIFNAQQTSLNAQSSQEQLLQRLVSDLQTAQRAQESSSQQLLSSAQQTEQSLKSLRQLTQQISERGGAQSGGGSAESQMGAQLVMRVLQDKEEKRWSHVTPMMIIGLFIQILSLVLISFVAVKLFT